MEQFRFLFKVAAKKKKKNQTIRDFKSCRGKVVINICST